MTVESTIDYEGLAQEAMRGVVRKVLARTAKNGLAGDHHFYISFDTESPGVTLSKRLKEKYPREMTIVLQHRFWDLIVTEERFEVKLTFDGIPERLVVPFAALKVFFDPSVRFGLQFEDPGASPEGAFETLNPRGAVARAGHARKSPRARKAETAADAEAGVVAASGARDRPIAEEDAPPPTPLGAPAAGKSGAKRAAASDDHAPVADAETPAKSGGAEIVSLDKFRKK